MPPKPQGAAGEGRTWTSLSDEVIQRVTFNVQCRLSECVAQYSGSDCSLPFPQVHYVTGFHSSSCKTNLKTAHMRAIGILRGWNTLYCIFWLLWYFTVCFKCFQVLMCFVFGGFFHIQKMNWRVFKAYDGNAQRTEHSFINVENVMKQTHFKTSEESKMSSMHISVFSPRLGCAWFCVYKCPFLAQVVTR